MKHILYPDKYLDSVDQIDFGRLYQEGFRGLIFDIDNTLVPHGAPADEKAVRLFARLRQLGFDSVLLSNNKEPRVKPFADRVGSRYIYKAGKPGVKSYQKAMEWMQTGCSNTLFIGDQIFTEPTGRELRLIWSSRSIRKKRFRSYSNGIWKKSYCFFI